MSKDEQAAVPVRIAIGIARQVAFDAVAWGPAEADVDLSVACMFEHEMDQVEGEAVGGAKGGNGATMSGGLLALDLALGGLLSRMRASGAFRAQEMETMLVSLLPEAMPPRAVLIIGMGKPETLSPDLLRRATRVAMREAIRLGVASLAFAPSVLDAGHRDNAGLDMPNMMMEGMLGALAAEHALADAGFARVPVLRACSLDVGAARVTATAAAARAALDSGFAADIR